MKIPFVNRPITRQPVHIIYRLAGSLPVAVLKNLERDYKSKLDQLWFDFEHLNSRSREQELEYQDKVHSLKKRFQASHDHLLDQRKTGPSWLKTPSAKQVVIDSWLFIEKVDPIEIDAISVMSNHVHILLSHAEEEGSIDLVSIMARHKHFTAVAINKLLGRVGERFWAKKAFDRDVRRSAYGTVLWYILNNPVKAGLTNDPLNWAGNYLAERLR